MTLLEMLVACGLFLIFIALSGELIVQMLRNYRQGEAIVRPIQQARNALGLMSTTMRGTLKVLPSPTNEAVLGYGAHALAIEIYSDQTRYVRFAQEPDSSVRYYELYPDQTVKSQRLLLQYARNLTFRKQPRDPVMVIELETVTGVPIPTPAEPGVPYKLQTMLFMRAYR